MKKIALLILCLMLSVIIAFGQTGTYTTNGYFYLPAYGEYGTDAFDEYNLYMQIADTQIEANKTATETEAGLEAALTDVTDVYTDNDFDITDYYTSAETDAADSDTTYTAGTGLDLTGTVFSLDASAFDLNDFPADPDADRYLFWNDTTGALIWAEGSGSGVTTFVGLTDTPLAYTGYAGYFPKVNAGATALEFAELTESDISDFGSYLENVVEDTTPELGGELDAGANSIGFTLQTVAEADGTTTIDWKLGNHCKVTLGAQAETFTFTAPSNPCNLTLIIVQDATGGRDITWPAAVKWLGTEATWTDGGAGKGIVVGFIYDGTNYWGQATPWES